MRCLITVPRVRTGPDNQIRQCFITHNVSDNSSDDDKKKRQGDNKLTKFVCVSRLCH